MRQKESTEHQTDGHRCPTCGSVHDTYAGVKIHHAKAHGESIAGEEIKCSVCGKTVRKTRSHIENAENPVCSKECSGILTSRREPWNKQEGVVSECAWCGGEFEHRPHENRRFCSRGCYDKHQSEHGHFNGETNPKYTGGKETHICDFCQGEYERYPSKPARFCSAECRVEWLSTRTAQDHPLWKGGVGWYRAIRSSLGPTGWHTQRKEHLGDECELCGESAATLALHHIIPVLAGGTNADYNYMTLCRSCHTTVEDVTRQFAPPLLIE